MSATAVEAVEPEVRPAAVVDNVNDHTPDPPPVAPSVPTPPRADREGLEELRETVASLATAVATLTDLVMAKAVGSDAGPRNVPWTHKGGKHDA